MSKEGLQAVVNGNDAAGGGWSSEMLRDLFTLRQDTASDTYDSRCRPNDDDSMEADNGTEQALAPPEHKLQVTHHFCADGLRFHAMPGTACLHEHGCPILLCINYSRGTCSYINSCCLYCTPDSSLS